MPQHRPDPARARRHTRLLDGLDAEIPLTPTALYLDEGVLFARYRLRV
ncbi:hypothetical protein [Actinomadura madurae]|nr:hypothetical protein [Actinomadura madurae]MCQ0014493.1 hypothetical protein [Actinomadura madurae]